MKQRAVIVGAGVIGVACADLLARQGWAVTLLDRGRVGAACSHGNCGYVCPSHVLPLAGPGVLVSTLKVLFRSHSPLAIRWRADPALWGWLFRFARRCNRRDMLRAGHALHGLLQSSRREYDRLFDGGDVSAEWSPTGLLFVFGSRHEHEHYASTDQLLRKEFGVPAERFDGDAVDALEPALRSGLAGGWLYRGDGHLQPATLMRSWATRCVRSGVTIREDRAVDDLVIRNGRAIAVRAGAEDFPAEAVIIAAGAWTPLLHRLIGAKVPIQPGKGLSITTSRPARCPQYPLIFEERRVAVTPFADSYRVGSTMEFAGYDTTINPRRLELLKQGAAEFLQEPLGGELREEWMGWRPMVPDGLPIIGRAPRAENVWLATGHGMLGVTLAPGTAKLIAELVTGQAPHVDPTPFRVGRF